MQSQRVRYLSFGAVMAIACGASFVGGLMAQEPTSALVGRVYQSGDGTQLKILYDGPRQGGEVDVAEITFPAGSNSGDHNHGETEVFYMLEGTLQHQVNGETHVLTPGMLGFVNPPDAVNHVVEAGGPDAKALVIWAPGGLAARLTSRWELIEQP